MSKLQKSLAGVTQNEFDPDQDPELDEILEWSLDASSNPQNMRLTSETQVTCSPTDTVLGGSNGQDSSLDSSPSFSKNNQLCLLHESAVLSEMTNKKLHLLDDSIYKYVYVSNVNEYINNGHDKLVNNNIPQSCFAVTNFAPASAAPFVMPFTYFWNSGNSHLGYETASFQEKVNVVSIDAKQITNVASGVTSLPSVVNGQNIQQTAASEISDKLNFVNNQHTTPTNGGITTGLSLGFVPTLPRVPPFGGKWTSTIHGNQAAKRAYFSLYQKSVPGKSSAKGRMYRYGVISDAERLLKRRRQNYMERKRRMDLRKAFDELSVLLPDVGSKKRPTKIVILREAAAYCIKLKKESNSYLKEIAQLRHHFNHCEKQIAHEGSNVVDK